MGTIIKMIFMMVFMMVLSWFLNGFIMVLSWFLEWFYNGYYSLLSASRRFGLRFLAKQAGPSGQAELQSGR